MKESIAIFKTSGMSRDVSESAFKTEFSFENMNVRLSTVEGNTLFSLANERGPLDLKATITGTPIGYAVIDGKIVLFTTYYIGLTNHSNIYLIDVSDDKVDYELMYSGDLNFSVKYPIETLPIYENENAVKVYWVDGLNQPRVINIADFYNDKDSLRNGVNTQFDFIPTMELGESCSVTKDSLASGTFSPGTVQYVCTYYNKYGQETNIFYTSSLFYVSYSNSAGSPEDRVSNAFNIVLKDLDPNFDYVRIYSLHRTSIDSVPTVRRVADMAIQNSTEQVYITQSSDTDVYIENVDFNSDKVTTGQYNNQQIGYFMSLSAVRKASSTGVDERGKYYKIPLYIEDAGGGNSTFIQFKGITYYAGTAEHQALWYIKVYYNGDQFSSISDGNGNIAIGEEEGREITWKTPNVNNVRTVKYTDDGESGETIDPSQLLFVGGRYLVAGTIAQKDNTLFLGNLRTDGALVPDEVSQSVQESFKGNFNFVNDKALEEKYQTGVYPYTNHLDKSLSQIATFKYGEWYRFGLQFQRNTGEWSEPVWIGDKQNDKPINGAKDTLGSLANILTQAKFDLTQDNVSTLRKYYRKVRPVVVYPSPTDRSVVCQGVLNPTIFNVADRISNSPFAQSSWFFRPNAPVQITDYSPEATPSSQRQYLVLVSNRKPAMPNIDLIVSETQYYGGRGHRVNLNFIGYKLANASGSSVSGYVGLYEIGPSSNGYTVQQISNILYDVSQNHSNKYYVHIGNYSDNVYVMAYGTADMISAVMADTSGELWIDPSYSNSQAQTIVSSGVVLSQQSDLPSNLAWKVEIGIKGDMFSNSGDLLEFRHFRSLPPSDTHSAEIQCNVMSLPDPYLGTVTTSQFKTYADTKKDYLGKFSDLFFIDQSIVTFHSPDIEFDTNLRGLTQDGLKLRIVGYVPITGTVSDLDIRTSTPALNYRASDGSEATVAEGFYKETVGAANRSSQGYLGLVSKNAWLDEVYTSDKSNYNKQHWTYGFPVYPWHRKGSLNNQSYNSKNPDANNSSVETPTDYRSAELKNKKMSNLRFSLKPVYIDAMGSSTPSEYQYSMAGLQVFDSDQPMNLRLPSPNGKDTVNYYGNVDRLVSNMTQWKVEDDEIGLGTTTTGKNYSGYPLASTVYNRPSEQHSMFAGKISYLKKWNPDSIGKIIPNWKDVFSVDPVQIKYKSGIHAVLSLKGAATSSETYLNVLPTCGNLNKQGSQSGVPFYDQITYHVSQNNYPQIAPDYGWLWLADIVRENVSNRFGGYDSEGKPTKDAIESNNWIPCGPDVSLDGDSIQVVWNEGDTYFQRYDCLKTYPFTMDDTNSVVDILSFMCETRINLDGRYDKNRGQTDNLTMSPENFNLLNEVYSQRNNFFNYRILDKDLFNFESYPYTITWTKTKNNGEKVDTWTNLTMASTLDLDGDKGSITSLKKINGSIIAFQEKGVSTVLYNEQTQLSTAEGVPIEISNSGKVTGKRYFSDSVGCLNKWSICQTPNGIYFIDDYNKSLNMLTGKGDMVSLSDTKGFHSWMADHCSAEVWNPSDFGNVVSYYDQKNQDVYFIGKDWCLAFSEGMGTFSSFYNYEGTPYLINLDGQGYWIRNKSPFFQADTDIWNPKLEISNAITGNPLKYSGLLQGNSQVLSQSVGSLDKIGAIDKSLLQQTTVSGQSQLENTISALLPSLKFDTTYCTVWKHNCGDYNYFFGAYKPYWTTIIANGGTYNDKIFSTVDFRSDSWDKERLSGNTFDKLEVWNEYQRGEAGLKNSTTSVRKLSSPSNLKQKFRVWRAQIPRDVSNKRDRMRNPWLYIKLSRTSPNTERMVLHDITVHYFE